MRRALADPVRGLGKEKVEAPEDILDRIAILANGDARSAYNTLEALVMGTTPDADSRRVLSQARLEDVLQKKFLLYDKSGEEHFNLISALHKSVRNSDADASLYWLARMLEAGEDPLYVARRLVRMASEDIGLAEPHAVQVTLAAMQAFEFLGPPEGNLALAQAAVYLALAPKSNAVYTAYGDVQEDLQKTIAEPVPLHLRNAVTGLMKHIGYGKGYQYAHNVGGKSYGYDLSAGKSGRSRVLSSDRSGVRSANPAEDGRNPPHQNKAFGRKGQGMSKRGCREVIQRMEKRVSPIGAGACSMSSAAVSRPRKSACQD